VVGNATQTDPLVLIEKSDGTDLMTLDNDGDLFIDGNLYLDDDNDFRMGHYITLTDDDATSFVPYTSYGLLFIYMIGGTTINTIITYRATSSPFGTIWVDPSSVITVGTSALTGTDGTDGKFNVGITNGRIYLENRRGSNAYLIFFTIGR